MCRSPQSPQKHSTADTKCITLVRDMKNARALLERWKANEVGLHPAHFHLVCCSSLLRDLVGWTDQGPLAKSEKAL